MLGSSPLRVFLTLLAVTPVAAAGTFEIVESDATHIRIAFTNDDYRFEVVEIDGVDHHEVVSPAIGHVQGDAGSPKLPLFVTSVAVPPGTRPVLTIVEAEVTTEPGIRPVPIPREEILPEEQAGGIATPVARLAPSPEAYARRAFVPETMAALGDVGRLRNLSVVPIRVTPFRYRAGELVVARRIVLDVTFGAPQGGASGRHVPVLRDPGAERLYARNVLNAEESRRWRHRDAVPVSHALRTRGLRRGAGPEAKLRIDANRNELVRVTRARLASAGWTATPPIADLRLTTRDYHADSLDVGGDPFVETPIGILVEDANGNAIFDGGDAFVFYAQDAKTQRGWVAPEDRYSWENVYWVSAEAGRGTEMPVRDWTPSGAPVTPSRFESWTRYEEQNAYYWYTLYEEELTAPIDRRQKVDHLFSTHWAIGYDFNWGGEEESIWRLPFEIRDPAPGSGLGVRAEWLGV
jgi:hypothetical protein